jgi:dTDP-4-dehydrorhamnose reductase
MFSHDIIKKRIFVTGSNGMLGQRVVKYFAERENTEVLGCSVEEYPVYDNAGYTCCDISKRESIKKVIFDFCPDFIVNTAAFTNVDKSEIEREAAWKVNVKGVEYLAESARVMDAHLIHFSTDYIFDGRNGPYSENSKPNPLGYYGRTKLASENALKISGAMYTILRINVLYGIANSRPDFVRWVVNMLSSLKEIRIVTDQINNPTFIDDLIKVISTIMEFRKQGIYHIGGRDFISRYDFTQIIADYFDLDKNLIVPILTEELNQTAKRSLKSGLITIRAESELGFKPYSLEESLAMMKTEIIL